jgi:hypothetical protein
VKVTGIGSDELALEDLRQIGVVGSRGTGAGEFDIVHYMAVDSRGNLYTAEIVNNRRAQKLVPEYSDPPAD